MLNERAGNATAHRFANGAAFEASDYQQTGMQS